MEPQNKTTICPHFSRMKISQGSPQTHAPFLKPFQSLTNNWICLYDACINKSMRHQELVCEAQSTNLQQYQELNNSHKIYIHTGSLQIYCTICEQEITDEHMGAKEIRKALVGEDLEQQKILYAGHMQYPPAFQKQKSGICGVIGNQLNSYATSVLQLLAHTPTFYQIAQQCQQTGTQLLRILFMKIIDIRSGKYRIIKIEELQAIIIKNNSQFNLYSQKNPANLQYQILRAFSDQFNYQGLQCSPRQVIAPLSLEKINPNRRNYRSYSPMKQLFSGYFKWIGKCQQCSHEKIIKSQFQCIRLQSNNQNKQIKQNADLLQLITNTFDLFSPHNNPFAHGTGKVCDQCKQKLQSTEVIQENNNAHIYNDKKYNIYETLKERCTIRMPNMLLLQFGNTGQGLKVKLPDQLNLTKFAQCASPIKRKDKGGQLIPQEDEFMFQYVGSIGKNKSKYICHVRQQIQRQIGSNIIKNYLFDDAIVKQDISIDKPYQIKLAIYRLKPLTKNKNIAKNISSSIQVNIKCYVPLPDFWYNYITNLRFVQPLISPFICQHGHFRPSVRSKSNLIWKVPPEIYQFLVEQFGGISALIKNEEQEDCSACQERLNLVLEIKQSQRQMAKFADKLSNKKNRVCIDLQWLQKWKKYLYNQCSNSYTMEGYRRPGPINNRKGLKQDQSDIDDSKYKKISPEVWYFFKKFYGGGPLITKIKADPSLALVQAVNLRFEAMKGKIEQYLQKD